MFKRQIDQRSEPVRRVLALGESTTWGYSVSDKSKCWVNQVVRMLEEFQGAEIELINQGIAEKNNLILADVYSAETGVDWIIDQDHCHPNDLGHRIIANRVFEAVVRSCSFVGRQMPKTSLIQPFVKKYGNGPDRPSKPGATTEVMPKKASDKKAEQPLPRDK